MNPLLDSHKNIKPYFRRKINVKKQKKVSSAAILLGSLRVNIHFKMKYSFSCSNSVVPDQKPSFALL